MPDVTYNLSPIALDRIARLAQMLDLSPADVVAWSVYYHEQGVLARRAKWAKDNTPAVTAPQHWDGNDIE